MRVEKGREVPEALLEAPQRRGQSGRVEVHLQIECQLLRGPAGKDSLSKLWGSHVSSDLLGRHFDVSVNFAAPHRILGRGILGENGAGAVVALWASQR